MAFIINQLLASKIENCIKQIHIKVSSQYTNGKILHINGGAACYSGNNSYLTQVIGWGFQTSMERLEQEIQQIEDFYHYLRHPTVDIEISPYVGTKIFTFLNQRNYHLRELNNVYLLSLDTYIEKEHICGFAIKKMDMEKMVEWAHTVAEGFNYKEAHNHFLQYAKAPDMSVFGAIDNEKIIAGAVLARHENFCDLGLASTLPAYRGNGIHKKLLIERLQYAKKMGLNWAVITTEPGSISDANVQKIGFKLAYTRLKLSRKQHIKPANTIKLNGA